MNRVERIVRKLKAEAGRGVWQGKGPTDYFRRCRNQDRKLGATVIFTRDVGHHTSGWWKNPDYERCFHLSLSFFDPETLCHRPRDVRLTSQFLDGFFGRKKQLLWCEPPYSDDGKRLDVWHYRLFCDPGWNPLKPRGEVYTRAFTEIGWKSFSDVQAQLETERKLQEEAERNR